MSRERNSSSRRRPLRESARSEVGNFDQPMSRLEAAGVVVVSTVIYGAAFPSPEGVSLGVLMGWLLAHGIPPLRPGMSR